MAGTRNGTISAVFVGVRIPGLPRERRRSREPLYRHRGSGRPLSPATPPDMRVRIGRFRGLRIAREQAR